MQLFILDENPIISAQYLCDKHCVKMSIEAAQICSTCLYKQNKWNSTLYRPTHIGHPCIIWTMESQNNFAWAVEHGIAVLEEYKLRYPNGYNNGKHHGTEKILNILKEYTKGINWKEHTRFVQAMPDYFVIKDDPVLAYRKYYQKTKLKFAKWMHGREKPNWLTIEDNNKSTTNS